MLFKDCKLCCLYYSSGLSMGPLFLTQFNPTHQLTDLTHGAYIFVVTYFIHRPYLSLLVNEASTYSCSLLIVII